jgi:hypothetical protein
MLRAGATLSDCGSVSPCDKMVDVPWCGPAGVDIPVIAFDVRRGYPTVSNAPYCAVGHGVYLSTRRVHDDGEDCEKVKH